MKNILNIDYEEISASLENNGFYIGSNIFSESLYKAAREEYKRILKVTPVHGQSIKFSPDDLEKEHWRKTAVGLTNGIGDPYPQLLQTTYLSLNRELSPALQDIAIGVKTARDNTMKNMGDIIDEENYADFWEASRIHHYPSGGGFMGMHCDTHFPRLFKGKKIPYLQVYAPLSQRGTDFSSGGAYVVDHNGRKVFTESDEMGTLVFFDGSIPHGVDPVDLHKVIDFSHSSGRLAIFSNLYERPKC